jgi:lysyl-tRNA synthetase class I
MGRHSSSSASSSDIQRLQEELALAQHRLKKLKERDVRLGRLEETQEEEIEAMEKLHRKEIKKLEERQEKEFDKLEARHDIEFEEMEARHEREQEDFEHNYDGILSDIDLSDHEEQN